MTDLCTPPDASTNTSVDAAAARLLAAHASGTPCAPVRDLIDDLDTAYAVQDRLTEHWLAQGRRLTGRKIGLTSPAVQRQLGVGTPDFGMLFADMAVPDGAEVPTGAVQQARAEAEVALVLEADLTHDRHTVADLLRATAFALPAIEVCGSRVRDWDIAITDTVADNASSGLYVLGTRPVPLRDLDLRLAGMVLERRGEQVSTGAGAACLGHPLTAALWLADTLVRVGRPLRAGDTVLTGALGPMVPVASGDVLEARIDGLGDVRVAFSPDDSDSDSHSHSVKEA
ncbi:fumarylacetoacetate hydrolase family protein [Streptomyces sp. B-S-A8]|uniref:Fumarylacetoacetate hydrolase family protein n=1 Tax=Streptomyces solicavernae TaxID=3043614 RepID=A0ABT6RUJ1_9ACTN|nr:fumarylacetoacetate hydrolase family protein [Streptomyces sp. B-S-A8]MDI3388094.1 fumarylacetoacetate hydrolase family protein [Streptomyces sp. B-S-A8]